MNNHHKLFILLLSISVLTLLSACSTSNISGHYSIYSDYHYPYYGYGYGGGYYRPDYPDRPDKPLKPENPIARPPKPVNPIARPPVNRPNPPSIGRPVTRPVSRPMPRTRGRR